MASLHLYGCWRSSASHRLQIGLRLKQLQFEYTPVSLDEREQHSDWYRALNPRGEVPTLVVDGTPWMQTLAILETLDERFPTQGVSLLPRDPKQRRLCRAIAEQVNSSLQPLLLPARIRQPILQAADPASAQALATALQAGVRDHQADALHALNTWLNDLPGPFCLGSEPTLADACVVAQLEAAMRLGLDLNPFKRLSELHTHCLRHQAFASSAPEQQPDAPSQAPTRSPQAPAGLNRSVLLSHKEPEAELSEYLGNTANQPIPGLQELRERTLEHYGVVASKMTSLDGCLLLRWLCRSRGVHRVLEVGVFTGSSSLALLDGLEGDGHLTAIDLEPRFTREAEAAWTALGLREQVTLLHGDANTRMAELEGQERFDLIYIDGDNGDYLHQLDLGLSLLNPGGLIVFDNVLWRGKVVDPGTDASALALDRLNRTLQQRPHLNCTVLSLSDGLALVEAIKAPPST